MKVLKRTEFGNPVLKRKAGIVSRKVIKTPATQNLIKEMIYTMRRVGGVGIAAPQVGKSLQLAVMEIRPTKTRPNLKKKGPIVIINPRILKFSKETSSDWEGCLSLRGVRGHVPRPKSITVEYLNEKAELIKEEASGLWARIFQHEIDHLNGKVYVERIEKLNTLMTLQEFKERVVKKKTERRKKL